MHDKKDLEKFFKGLLGFPANLFNEEDSNYQHNRETMEKIGKKLKGE